MKKTILFLSAISFLLMVVTFLFGKYLNLEQLNFIFIMPLIWLGNGIRYLSETHSVLNVFAWLIYILISLMPLFYLGILYQKKKYRKIDLLLIPISGLLGLLLYGLINPHLLSRLFISDIVRNLVPSDELNQVLFITKMAISMTWILIVLCYVLVRWILDKNKSIEKPMSILFKGCSVYLVYMTFMPSLLSVMKKTGNGYEVTLSIFNYLFLVTQIVMWVTLLLQTEQLLILMNRKHMDQTIVKKAQCIKRISSLFLVLLIVSALFENSYFLIFSKQLNATNYTLPIPILEMMFVFIFLILSHYLVNVFEVNEENRLTI